MKRFGFHAEHMYYNMRNPMKVRYVQTKELGKFEVPMKGKERNLHKLHEQFQRRQDFEKYLCPKGVKPTITSRFEQPRQEIDFLNHEMLLFRQTRDYGSKTVNFKVSPFLSQPEIEQYLRKLYKLPIESVRTVNKQGEIKRADAQSRHNKRYRRKDWKKAIVQLKYDVDPQYQRHM